MAEVGGQEVPTAQITEENRGTDRLHSAAADFPRKAFRNCPALMETSYTHVLVLNRSPSFWMGHRQMVKKYTNSCAYDVGCVFYFEKIAYSALAAEVLTMVTTVDQLRTPGVECGCLHVYGFGFVLSSLVFRDHLIWRRLAPVE